MRRTYTILVAVVALLVVTLGYAALATRTGHPSQRSSHPGATAGRTPLPARGGTPLPADGGTPVTADSGTPVPAGGGYFPLAPFTVVAPATMGARDGTTLQLAGTGGVPPGGVEAVALSLGAVPSASGRLALTAADQPPGADDPGVALSPGTTASAFLVVAVPSAGRVRLSNLSPGATTVSATVNGYYAAPCGGGGAGYEPAGPGWSVPRTAKLAPGQAAVLPVTEAGAAPVAVALDVRADEEAASGSLTVGPDEPGAVSGAAAGFRLVNLGPSGRVRLSNAGSFPVTATLRVHGWYRRGGGTSYRAAGPEPLLDRTIPAGATARFAATGVAGVPADGVGAVALELWASAAGSGQVEVAGGAALRLAGGQGTSGFDLVAPGADGHVAVHNGSGAPLRVTARARGYQGAPAALRTAPDPALRAVFDRSGVAEPGWTGGDGSVPVRLPDGRTAWLFGDSIYGTVGSDGGRSSSALVHNALVVQDGRRLETHVGPPGPPDGKVTALLAPTGVADTWLWPSTGVVDGGALQVFVQELRRPAGTSDQNAFEWTGRNLVATLSLPDLVPRGVVPVYGASQDGGGVAWGTAVLQEADFTYLYGIEDSGGPLHVKYVHLARFAPGEVHGYWTFWDGSGWSSDPASSARLSGARAGAAGGQEQVTGIPSGVVRAGASYLELSATDDGHEIMGRLGCSPAGPWGAPRVLHRVQQGDVAYLARAYQDGPGLLLAFSLAPLDQRRLFAQASTYLPRFVRVR